MPVRPAVLRRAGGTRLLLSATAAVGAALFLPTPSAAADNAQTAVAGLAASVLSPTVAHDRQSSSTVPPAVAHRGQDENPADLVAATPQSGAFGVSGGSPPVSLNGTPTLSSTVLLQPLPTGQAARLPVVRGVVPSGTALLAPALGSSRLFGTNELRPLVPAPLLPAVTSTPDLTDWTSGTAPVIGLTGQRDVVQTGAGSLTRLMRQPELPVPVRPPSGRLIDPTPELRSSLRSVDTAVQTYAPNAASMRYATLSAPSVYFFQARRLGTVGALAYTFPGSWARDVGEYNFYGRQFFTHDGVDWAFRTGAFGGIALASEAGSAWLGSSLRHAVTRPVLPLARTAVQTMNPQLARHLVTQPAAWLRTREVRSALPRTLRRLKDVDLRVGRGQLGLLAAINGVAYALDGPARRELLRRGVLPTPAQAAADPAAYLATTAYDMSVVALPSGTLFPLYDAVTDAWTWRSAAPAARQATLAAQSTRRAAGAGIWGALTGRGAQQAFTKAFPAAVQDTLRRPTLAGFARNLTESLVLSYAISGATTAVGMDPETEPLAGPLQDLARIRTDWERDDTGEGLRAAGLNLFETTLNAYDDAWEHGVTRPFEDFNRLSAGLSDGVGDALLGWAVPPAARARLDQQRAVRQQYEQERLTERAANPTFTFTAPHERLRVALRDGMRAEPRNHIERAVQVVPNLTQGVLTGGAALVTDSLGWAVDTRSTDDRFLDNPSWWDVSGNAFRRAWAGVTGASVSEVAAELPGFERHASGADLPDRTPAGIAPDARSDVAALDTAPEVSAEPGSVGLAGVPAVFAERIQTEERGLTEAERSFVGPWNPAYDPALWSGAETSIPTPGDPRWGRGLAGTGTIGQETVQVSATSRTPEPSTDAARTSAAPTGTDTPRSASAPAVEPVRPTPFEAASSALGEGLAALGDWASSSVQAVTGAADSTAPDRSLVTAGASASGTRGR